MPGTVGSAAALFILLPAWLLPSEFFFLAPLGGLVLSVALAALAIPPVLAATGMKDPQFIVLDEVAGVMAALCLTPPVFLRVLLAIVLFRVLDILKPFPIDRLERLPGWWGVVADDLAAGLLAGLLAAVPWVLL
jgi:phosphatidylglycerophosphatase A